MQVQTESINFTQRYVWALLLVAIVATVSLATLLWALKTAETTALIVNDSGKQRILSQRIASLGQNYFSHFSNGEQSDSKRVQSLLIDAINEMENTNQRLSSGELNEAVAFTPSEQINELYFGQSDVKHRVEIYLGLSRQLLDSNNTLELSDTLREVLMMSEALLPDLNAIVLQYQKEGEEKVAFIKYIEQIAWIFTIFTLLIIVIFIFQPMANTLRILFEKVEGNRNYLEQEIKLRTYDLEQANAKLQYSASHDPLTGLNNRLNLEHDLESILSHYHDNGVPFAVLMLDIDWFKKVNDNYGHDMGDFVLKELSALVRKAIRDGDKAYRAGGEEFVIILNRISHSQAMEKAQLLRQSIQEHPFVFGEHTLNITISGGLYHPTWHDKMDFHDVLKLVDNALYEAKRSGRNRIVETESSLSNSSSMLPLDITSVI